MKTQRIDRLKILFGALVILAMGIGAGAWWAGRSKAAPPTPIAQSADGADERERKILYWHDPMAPSARFDKPGKSPFMDMQLVPVYADEADQGAGVRVNSSVAQNLGIRVGKVEKAAVSTPLRAVGSVAFDESALQVVQARVAGYMIRLDVKAPLAQVKRGQSLAAILAPQWLEAEQEYLALLDAHSVSAQPIREAARRRLTVLGVPAATIRALETQRKPNATTTLVAPIDGVVTEIGAREGAAFAPGASLFQINGLSTVWVNAQIPEIQVAAVPMGSTVETTATAWPGMTFKGRVMALLPQVDPQTRTFTVRIALDNPEQKLSPGMFVSLAFTAPAREPQLMVPSEAVIMTGTRNVVLVAREDGSFEVADVTLGAELGERTVILSGLEEGQSIVLSGQFLIDSEASLKSALGRLGTAAAPRRAEPQP